MTQARRPDLQNFLTRLHEFIVLRARDDRSSAAVDRVFAALASRGTEGLSAAPQSLPVCSWLAEAIDAVPAAPEDVYALGAALGELAPLLAWKKREGLAAGPEFALGHANATIIGPQGLEPRKDVWVGVSLMAPLVTYPDHRHPPEELYAVLSPGEWKQDDGAWWEPGTGGLVYNPPNITHAMRSGAHCLLAVWCLPLD